MIKNKLNSIFNSTLDDNEIADSGDDRRLQRRRNKRR